MSSLQPGSGWITRLSARRWIVGTHYLPVRRPPKIDPRSSALMVFRFGRHDSQSLMVDAFVQPTPSVTRGNPDESRFDPGPNHGFGTAITSPTRRASCTRDVTSSLR